MINILTLSLSILCRSNGYSTDERQMDMSYEKLVKNDAICDFTPSHSFNKIHISVTPKSTSWVELSTMSPTLINPIMSCYYYHLHISKKHQTQQIQDQAYNFLLVNFLFWNFFSKYETEFSLCYLKNVKNLSVVIG